MNRTKSQYVRLMELDRLIRSGSYPNCLSFSADWEVSQKTVQRDIDFLRDQCGAPIAYDRERKGFYYEDGAWILPSVMLSEGELVAVLLASRALEQYEGTPVAEELRRLHGKLAEMLPGKISVRPEFLFERFTFRGPAARPVAPDIWTAVVRSLTGQYTLKMRYRPAGAAPEPDKRSWVNPYHLANLHGEWYLFGIHKGHEDVRQFALARIDQAEATGERFNLPPGFDPQKLLAGTFGRYAVDEVTHAVSLLFDKEVAEQVMDRQWHPQQSLRRRKNGDVDLAFPAKGLLEVKHWVLSWGRYVSVLKPRELREDVREEIAAMAKTAG